MSFEMDEVNYKKYINNDDCKKARFVEIKLLFVPKDVTLFQSHNYHSEITIFDYKLNDYLKMEALTSYEDDNPITRSDNVFFEDENGELEYHGKKYKCIDNLVIDNAECIPLFSFSNYVFKDVSITNTKRIKACAFFRSKVDSIYIDNNVEVIGFNGLPSKLKIIDGYYDIKNNPRLVLADINDIRKPTILSETKIIYQCAARESKYIEELMIPEGVTMIGSHAFCDCKSIRIISLPKSLKYIDERAFAHTRAKEVYYNGTLEDWNKIEIMDEDWSFREWLNHAVSLDSSPRKADNDFYVLDNNGTKEFDGKRYIRVENHQ